MLFLISVFRRFYCPLLLITFVETMDWRMDLLLRSFPFRNVNYYKLKLLVIIVKGNKTELLFRVSIWYYWRLWRRFSLPNVRSHVTEDACNKWSRTVTARPN